MLFHEALDDLIDGYLAAGCPCRFPRFRAFVKMNTSPSTGGSYTTPEQRCLVLAFESKVRIADKGAIPGAAGTVESGTWSGLCARCGSSITRSSYEIDSLVIRRKAGLVELGAPIVRGLVVRASPFIQVTRAWMGAGKAAMLWPCVGEEEFLRWLRERATPTA
jgi:hypothetical protein